MKLLAHSIENIYIQAGQYDRYSIFAFYPNSSSFLKYGGEVYGYIIYKPSERKELEKVLELTIDEMTSTDGLVHLDGALRNSQLNKLLLDDGFMASDIMRLSCMDSRPIKKVYGEQTNKEIPNTITVPISSKVNDVDDLLHMEWKLLDMRLRNGTPLIREEMQRYCTLIYILNPENLSDRELNEYLKDPLTEVFHPEVLITILGHKYERSIHTGVLHITTEEYFKLNSLLKNRRISRFDVIKRQLGISQAQIKEFKETNPEEYDELARRVVGFKTEVIVKVGSRYPIYWDFDRFIHIMLRHYKGFFIGGSTKRPGTSFQYIYKDIIRIIEIIIKIHLSEIEEAVSQAKEYRKYQDHGYYYNGNYYTFRISKDGKLMQFHPQE